MKKRSKKSGSLKIYVMPWGLVLTGKKLEVLEMLTLLASTPLTLSQWVLEGESLQMTIH